MGNNVDAYGVDHSGFIARDEVAYQTARQQRENRIMQNYNGQGISKDYPQYGTDFWGNSPENNYGFGASNITPNVENMQNTPVPNIGPKPLSQEQMYTPPSHAAEVLAAGIKGFGQGVLGGIEHGIKPNLLRLIVKDSEKCRQIIDGDNSMEVLREPKKGKVWPKCKYVIDR